MQYDWLDEGSLLLLLPEALLGAWHGAMTTDYARACEVAGPWLTSLPVAGGFGFLLGGDPGMALLVPGAGGAPRLIRWLYAEEEEELVQFVLRGEAAVTAEPDLVFDNEYSAWVMLDAAADPLFHRPPMRPFQLPLTRVHVTTILLESERNAAIIHEFRREA